MLKKSPGIFDGWTVTALAVLGTGIVLRLLHAGAPLVSDELASASIWAQMPFWTIPLNYQNTNNHILNTLLLGAGLRLFGTNHLMLRIPALLCGALSLWLGYTTTLRISRDKNVALGTLLLLTFSGIHIIHSDEARGYIIVLALGQMIVHLLLGRLPEGGNCNSPALEKGPVPVGRLFALWILCFLGTWTMPTFIIFEASLLLFFGGALLLKFQDRIFDLRFPCTRLSLVFLLSLASYGFQYYILIPREMLNGAYSFANSPSGAAAPLLLIGVLKNLVSPLDFLSLPFLVLMIIGMSSLLPGRKGLFFFLSCLLILIPVLLQIINFFSIFRINPPSRIFNYLQPFFFMTVSMGLFFALDKIAPVLQKKTGNRVRSSAPFLLVFAPFVFLSGRELTQNIYPAMAARPPFQKVKEFIERSGPNDLFLTSHRTHLWFYLYGANAMRKRVYHIIDTGELGGVYFLEYISGGDSDIKRIRRRGIDFFRMKDYASITRGPGGKSEALVMPASLFRLAADFGFCKIYRVRQEFVRKNHALKSRKDFERWKTYALHPAELRPVPSPGMPSLRFQGPLTMVLKGRAATPTNSFVLDLALGCKNDTPFQALLVNGKITGRSILMNPAWAADDWVLDHPYGSGIFNRPWRPFIFLSQPDRSREMVIVNRIRPLATGMIRGVQSYTLADAAP